MAFEEYKRMVVEELISRVFPCMTEEEVLSEIQEDDITLAYWGGKTAKMVVSEYISELGLVDLEGHGV